jgi:hypothetical protein
LGKVHKEALVDVKARDNDEIDNKKEGDVA